MKEILETMVRPLCDKPDEIQISESNEQGTVRLQLTVAESDMGKVIGRSGKTAQALRRILCIAALKTGVKVILDIG